MFSIVVRFELPDEDAAKLFDELTRQVVPGIRDHEPDTLLLPVQSTRPGSD